MQTRIHHWSHLLRSRMLALLPSSCALCGCAASDAICNACLLQYGRRRRQRCRQCASLLNNNEASSPVCGACLKNRPAFDATVVAVDYAAPLDQLVLALKFGSRLALAPLFSVMLRDAMLEQCDCALPTLLTAVPLSRQRLAERGFNQSLEIAKPLSRALGIELFPAAACRLRDTQAQATLRLQQRAKNIQHAFSVPADAIDRIRGQHIGIVDDVITTGETLNELAATLKRFGATRVTNLVFARTPAH
ncbi:MAG: ComF family protein [Glaciimonas sp.]|nr:ComF family protein [Glaciimonas sp.]